MKLNTLHHYLTDYSENEQKYQTGLVKNWNQVPKTLVNDREVYFFNIPNTYFSALHSRQFNGKTPLLPSNPYIYINKNSRFNPVPEHIHSHIEINYVYSGCCQQKINDNEILMQKNQVLLIDTGCPHSIAALGKDDIMISISVQRDFIKKHMFSQFSKDSILSQFFINAINTKTIHNHFLLFHSENNRRIPLFFQELFCECFDPSINSSDILIHLFYLIMAELINVYENDLTKEKEFSSASPIVPLIRYIDSNFLTCTQKSVADFFHISPNYVSTLLKKHLGMNYIQIIQEHKLLYAAKLLKNTLLSVTEISLEAGYENINFFYQKFTRKFGCSPKEFRKLSQDQ